MRENKHLEFKQEINDKFLKTVSAFANYDGGDIIFGIADDGEKTGLKNIDQQCLIIENKINDSLEPKPDFTLSVNEKDKTITLHVNRGSHPPYLYKNKAYKRNSTSTVETDIIETKRLILDGERLNLEELKSNNQHLSFTYLEKEFQEVLGIKALNEDVLKTLNLFSDTDGYNIAALILSDQNSFPGIDIARFGENINIILHRVTFENCSLLKMFNEAINIFEQYYAYEEIKGSRREKIYTIPLEAFREALANAIVHRMWDINAYVRVAMFANKIEIYSPGGLPRDISEDEYLNGLISKLRNPIISNVFFRLKIIETFGTGITKIKQAYEAITPKPEFEIYSNSIKVTLPAKDAKAALTGDEEAIKLLLSKERLATSSEIAKLAGFSKAKTIQLLKSLAAKKVIKIEGTGRGTKYRLNL